MWKMIVLTIWLTITGVLGTMVLAYIEMGTFDGTSFYGAVLFVPILIAPAMLMKIDGKDYFVTVNIEGLALAVTLPEIEQNIVYSMIDTVNDVINKITSSKNYSEFSEE